MHVEKTSPWQVEAAPSFARQRNLLASTTGLNNLFARDQLVTHAIELLLDLEAFSSSSHFCQSAVLEDTYYALSATTLS